MSAWVLDPVPQLVIRAALSLLFAWAAQHKLRDVAAFRVALEGYALVPARWTVPFGAGLIAVEVGIAAGLWAPRVSPVAALAAACLLILYGSAIAINLVRGRRAIDCGCAGPARRRPIGWTLVVRNAVLAGAALASAWPGASRPLTWFDAVTVVAAVPALVFLYAAADGLMAVRGASLDATADGEDSAARPARGLEVLHG
jgi:hypothetical protein